MALTYTWKVKSVKTASANGLENAVVQTHWEKIGKDDDGVEGVFQGATPFPIDKITGNDFIPFEDLTEETILGWIKAVVVDDYERHVNERIQREIDSKKIKVVEADLPWIKKSGEE